MRHAMLPRRCNTFMLNDASRMKTLRMMLLMVGHKRSGASMRQPARANMLPYDESLLDGKQTRILLFRFRERPVTTNNRRNIDGVNTRQQRVKEIESSTRGDATYIITRVNIHDASADNASIPSTILRMLTAGLITCTAPPLLLLAR